MEKRRQPVQKRSQETLEGIYQAARDLFSIHGLQKVSTHQIAKEAGISIGTFYLYFPDKGTLFVELLGRRLKEFQQLHRELGLQTIPDVRQRLKRLWEALLTWARSWDRFFLDVSALYYADSSMRASIDAIEAVYLVELAQVFDPWHENLPEEQQRAKAVFLYHTLEATLRNVLVSDDALGNMLGEELITCLTLYVTSQP